VNFMLEVKIVRADVSAAKAQEKTDHVAEEKPFYIFLNRTHYATIFCSPSNLKELAVRHALSEGTLKSRARFSGLQSVTTINIADEVVNFVLAEMNK